jgi:hypothetical protein
MAHVYNPGNWETESGGSGIQGCVDYKARPCLKKN